MRVKQACPVGQPVGAVPTFVPPPRSVRQALGRLNAREEVVVRLSFGIGASPRELTSVATALGLTPADVRRLQERAFRKLRALATSPGQISRPSQNGKPPPQVSA